MKRILAILTLASAMFTAKAQSPVHVQVAGSWWNTAWNNADFFWYPDGGPDFEVKFYTHVLNQDGSRTYQYNATRNYGGYDFTFYDAFNTASTLGNPPRYTHVFMLVRYHLSSVSYNDAYADYPDGYPQWPMAVSNWVPGAGWHTVGTDLTDGKYWELYLVHYNAFYNSMWVQWMANGGTSNYPPNINDYAYPYGSW